MSSLLNYKSLLSKYLYKLQDTESEFSSNSTTLLNKLDKQVKIDIYLENMITILLKILLNIIKKMVPFQGI